MSVGEFVFRDLELWEAAELAEWYRIYRIAFPHPDEQEPLEFFRQILVMNDNKELQGRFGPYREFVTAICDAQTRKIVGGLNIGVTTGPAHWAAGIAASVHAIFLFVAPEHRGHVGRARGAMLNEMQKRALEAFPPTPEHPSRDIAIFFEVNNPLDMSPDEIVEDYANSGVDTYRRYNAWLDIGWPLDFRYVQPRLSSDQEPVLFLHLFYRGPGKGKSISADMLLHHLRSFISLSVLKGLEAEDDPDFARMALDLRARTQVGFVPPDDHDLHAIKTEALSRSATQVRRTAPAEKSLDFPDAASAFAEPGRLRNLVIILKNRAYQACRAVYLKIEPWHIFMAHVELLALAFALITSVISLTGVLEQEHKFVIDMFDIGLFALLFVYLGTRLLVQQRRDRLGPSLGSVRAEMRQRESATAGGMEPAFEWLAEQLTSRAAALQASGYVIGADLPPATRQARLAKLASYAAPVYSEHIWDGDDRTFADREYRRFLTYLESFHQGLWGARFDNCPSRYFFSLILPVSLPTVQTPIDLEMPAIDRPRARRLAGRTPDAIGDGGASAAPCLLILRQLASGPLKNVAESPPLERELDLLLTTLLHLADNLEQLAHGGDIAEGLEACSFLCVASNRVTQWLLEAFGFRLLQSPEAGDRSRAHEYDSHFSLYSLTVEKRNHSREAQRLLQLLSQLQHARRTAAKRQGNAPEFGIPGIRGT